MAIADLSNAELAEHVTYGVDKLAAALDAPDCDILEAYAALGHTRMALNELRTRVLAKHDEKSPVAAG